MVLGLSTGKAREIAKFGGRDMGLLDLHSGRDGLTAVNGDLHQIHNETLNPKVYSPP